MSVVAFTFTFAFLASATSAELDIAIPFAAAGIPVGPSGDIAAACIEGSWVAAGTASAACLGTVQTPWAFGQAFLVVVLAFRILAGT